MSGPVLIACAHGTRSVPGQRAYAALARAIAATRPQLRVEPAFVDVQAPDVGDLVAALVDGGEQVVVVPLLLASGYHVGIDVARSVRGRPSAVAARAVGPDPVLAEMLAEMLAVLPIEPASVVLAATGSSDAGAMSELRQLLGWFAAKCPVPVRLGYAAGVDPRISDTVTDARLDGSPVAIVSYLLVPGHFHSVLGKAGADAVTPPLCPSDRVDPRLVRLVLDRYDEAAGRLPG